MKGRMNRTWSLDNIKVKDNFYDYVTMCRNLIRVSHHHN